MKKDAIDKIVDDIPGLSWWPREPEDAEEQNRQHRASFDKRIRRVVWRAIREAYRAGNQINNPGCSIKLAAEQKRKLEMRYKIKLDQGKNSW